MASLVVQADRLVVKLSPLEKLMAFSGNISVPLASVTAIAVEPDPWSALRGIRAPGTGLPGVVAYGVRRLTGDRRDFAAIRGRQAAVRVELGPAATFGRLVVTVADPEATVAATRASPRS